MLRDDAGAEGMRPADAPERGSDGRAADVLTPPFRSILFPHSNEDRRAGQEAAPDFFRDLNLDQVVAAVTAGYEGYDLAPFFHDPLGDVETIVYRQAVMRDLEDEAIAAALRRFAQRMNDVLSQRVFASRLESTEFRQGAILTAVELYSTGVERLAEDLAGLAPASAGVQAFRQFVSHYVGSERFGRLASEARRLTAELSGIRYAIRIDGDSVTVTHYEGEADYSADVEETFAKFRRGAVKDYRRRFGASTKNHIEAQVLERVAWLNPGPFRALGDFCTQHRDFLDDTLVRFHREVQFYLAYLGFIAPIRRAGLGFCYPQLSPESKRVSVRAAFDLALAHKRVREQGRVVPNDVSLQGAERILVVSGPNQGGKTTFARMFGQLHYLARLGCPVPGAEARLFLCDDLFCHFERAESLASLRGKLEDDLVRVKAILDKATGRSIVILNEVFASTTLSDATFLGREVLERISALDALCVCVTFLDELATLNEKVVSMVGTVNPSDPAQRTFKLERRPADGLAYALAIAERRGVTYARLMKRIKP